MWIDWLIVHFFLVSTHRSGAPLATIIYNTQHSPYIFEEPPPTYDSLSEVKKDPHGQLPLTPLATINEEVTAPATEINIPSAPAPPSEIYANINEPHKY